MDGGPWKVTVHGVAESDSTKQRLLTYSLTALTSSLSFQPFGSPSFHRYCIAVSRLFWVVLV